MATERNYTLVGSPQGSPSLPRKVAAIQRNQDVDNLLTMIPDPNVSYTIIGMYAFHKLVLANPQKGTMMIYTKTGSTQIHITVQNGTAASFFAQLTLYGTYKIPNLRGFKRNDSGTARPNLHSTTSFEWKINASTTQSVFRPQVQYSFNDVYKKLIDIANINYNEHFDKVIDIEATIFKYEIRPTTNSVAVAVHLKDNDGKAVIVEGWQNSFNADWEDLLIKKSKICITHLRCALEFKYPSEKFVLNAESQSIILALDSDVECNHASEIHYMTKHNIPTHAPIPNFILIEGKSLIFNCFRLFID